MLRRYRWTLFSVIVGILPMAVAGIDVDEVMDGAVAVHMVPECLKAETLHQYAPWNIFYRKGKTGNL